MIDSELDWINHRKLIFLFFSIVVSSPGTIHRKLLDTLVCCRCDGIFVFKLLSPEKKWTKKNEMEHYEIALAPNLIFIVWARDKCLVPHTQLSTHLNTRLRLLFEREKKMSFSTWTQNDVVRAPYQQKWGDKKITNKQITTVLWQKDQRLHGKWYWTTVCRTQDTLVVVTRKFICFSSGRMVPRFLVIRIRECIKFENKCSSIDVTRLDARQRPQ